MQYMQFSARSQGNRLPFVYQASAVRLRRNADQDFFHIGSRLDIPSAPDFSGCAQALKRKCAKMALIGGRDFRAWLKRWSPVGPWAAFGCLGVDSAFNYPPLGLRPSAKPRQSKPAKTG
jgi:hypothetical protein